MVYIYDDIDVYLNDVYVMCVCVYLLPTLFLTLHPSEKTCKKMGGWVELFKK